MMASKRSLNSFTLPAISAVSFRFSSRAVWTCWAWAASAWSTLSARVEALENPVTTSALSSEIAELTDASAASMADKHASSHEAKNLRAEGTRTT